MGFFGLQFGDFLLTHPDARLFDRPQCGAFPVPLFVFYRLVVAAYVLAIITFNQAYKFDRDPNPFTYLTNWNFMTQAIALSVKAVVACYRAALDGCKAPGRPKGFEDDDDDDDVADHSMTWYLKLEWVLHNVSSCIPLVVLSYWSGFEQQKAIKWDQPLFLFFTVQTHGLTAVLALVDVLLGAIPSRVLHFYQPIAFLVIYYSFTAVYFAATGGNLIYPDLDWNDPGATLLQLLVRCLLALAAHLGICVVKAAQNKWCCSAPRAHSRKTSIEEKRPLIYDELA